MTQSFVGSLVLGGNLLFDPSNVSSFGTLETAELTPVFQGDFVYGLNTQLWNSAVVSGTGATVDTNTGRLRIQCGTGGAGYAYILNRRPARYRAGQGILARFTPLFGSGITNNVQLWGIGSIASNVPNDGLFFGYNGSSFGIVHYNRGTPTWYTQTGDWNGDKCDGSSGSSFTYDPTLGTPVMIKYPYLGYGNISFYVQNPNNSRWILCHTIKYANTTSNTQLGNPTLQFLGFTLNSGNTTNKTMYCGSVGIFISGVRSFVGNPAWAADNNKSGITTETNLLSLKNATIYNGVTNRSLIRLAMLSISSSAASGIAVFRFKRGVTLGGAPSYTTRDGATGDNGVTITNGNSVASFDVAGTTITGGTYEFGVTVDNPNSDAINILPNDLFISPGEVLTVSGYSTISSAMGVALNWTEDI